MPTDEPRSRSAAIVSFVLHLLLILLAIRLTAAVALPAHSPLGDAIQMVLGGGGGGGGQSGAAFHHPANAPTPTPVPPPVVPPPPPPPPVVTPTVVPPPVQAVPPPAAAAPPGSITAAVGGTGTGSGGGNGSGVGIGTGSGEGAGKGSGTGGGNGGFPPENKQMILPPTDVPKELRGKPITVVFTVDSTGVVTGLVVTPPIENHNYAKRFEDAMRGYRFTPARNTAGRNVAGVAKYEVTLGSK